MTTYTTNRGPCANCGHGEISHLFRESKERGRCTVTEALGSKPEPCTCPYYQEVTR
jgi:hypothetical protein